MKKLLVLASLIFISFSAFAYDSNPINVIGNPFTYTKTQYSVSTKFGEYFRSPTVKHVHLFNSSGQETETVSYTAKDAIVDKLVYTYDVSHNLESTTFYDSSENVLCITKNEYNAQGQLASESEYDAEGNLVGKTIYKYDVKKITESYYDGEGALFTREISTFNDKGKIIELCIYYGDGSLDKQHVYSYDSNGNLSTDEIYGNNKEFKGKQVYKYQAVGSIYAVSEIITYNSSNKIIERIKYKLDDYGNPTTISVYEVAEKFGATSNELTSITTFTYKYN